jgi:pimeloyl-ACP methyl ester carboxylesterase
MPFFTHDDIRFHYHETGQGRAFVFQHGLGGDVNQPFGLFRPPEGVRLLAFDCRGHGETRPLGPIEHIGIAAFADDLVAFMDHLQLGKAVLGGISMGAAVALNAALRYPQRVSRLVLSRPAWLDQPNPPNLHVYEFIARLIHEQGPLQGLARFRCSEVYRSVLRESPDAANSLVGQFEHPRAEETVVKLERIPHDSPVSDLSMLQTIHVPTLVMANRQDPVHPFDYGIRLAQAIPGATLVELTPKSINKDQHAADVQAALSRFLTFYSPHSSS